MKTKAKVIRKVSLNGNGFFEIYSNDKFIISVAFRMGESETSIWNQEKNFDQAMLYVKKIESGEGGIEETVYETPDNVESLTEDNTNIHCDGQI